MFGNQRLLLFVIGIALSEFSCTGTGSKRPAAGVNLKYSAFIWHYNDGDRSQVYVASYLEIRGDSFFIMRHRAFNDTAHYYAGVLDKAVRMQIDNFQDSAYRGFKEPILSDSNFSIYDGFYYCLEVERPGRSGDTVLFVPRSAPARLRQLASFLDSLVESGGPRTYPFSIERYKAELARIAIRSGLIPPKVEAPHIEIKRR